MSFLIHKEHKALILNVLDPSHVLNNVPGSTQINYQGRPLVVVPHDLVRTQSLRALGYPMPSPIGYQYDWPRERGLIPSPFLHQFETSGFLTLNKRCYCLNEIGTGKTNSALWAADYLMSIGLVRKALVISPLSTLERVWGDSVFIHLQHRSVAVLHGTAQKRKKLFANPNYDFYVINPDAIDIITEMTFKEKRERKDPLNPHEVPAVVRRLSSAQLLRDDIDLIIIDEVAMFRNSATNRYRILSKLIKPNMWVWGLTGTPVPQEPTDAWAQCKLITPERVPQFFSMFRQQTMQQLTEYTWAPRKEAPEIVFNAMQPAIRFTRDECFDLPECTYSTRQVELSAEQAKHYKELVTQLTTDINGGQISAVNEGVKQGKLVQIACGVVYDKNGIERAMEAGPRVTEVKNIIEEAGHKVIVFVPYTAPLKMLAAELSKTYTVASVHGEVSKAERDKIFSDFQKLPNPRVLVADAGCMSHGLTLTEANTIVWYGAEVSNDTYTQANGRITRPGQKNAQHIIHIVSTEVEKRINTRTDRRGKTQNVLLEMVKKGVSLL